jgi:hypothetical protein
MKILSGQAISEGIDSFERSILEKILIWKISYDTPFDFINIIAMRISYLLQFEKSKEIAIITKANQICELLLLCIDTCFNYN